jgi:bifunctional enzyme CysN/CysC
VDLATEFIDTGRFVILQDYDICGGGLVREVLQAPSVASKETQQWVFGNIPSEMRTARYQQKPVLVILASTNLPVLKSIAERLESELFIEGRLVFLLGAASLLQSAQSRFSGGLTAKDEIIERFAEIADVLLKAGFLVIGTVGELTQERFERIRERTNPSPIETIQIGHHHENAIGVDHYDCDVQIDVLTSATEEAVHKIRQWLVARRIHQQA